MSLPVHFFHFVHALPTRFLGGRFLGGRSSAVDIATTAGATENIMAFTCARSTMFGGSLFATSGNFVLHPVIVVEVDAATITRVKVIAMGASRVIGLAPLAFSTAPRPTDH